MSKLAKALTAAAGNAGESLYVEDVFSTYLYTGNNSSQTITNNIDLAGEGGLVWFKRRSTARTHILIDTERGKTSYLQSNETVAAETGITNTITSFNSDGFSISDQQDINGNAETVASWTFRKAEKFFDVVTYTGTGSATTISHNLGSVPGVMIIKRASDTESWQVYHKDFATDEYIQLNGTAASTTVNGTLRWNNTRPTDTVFSIGTHNSVNGSGDTYVAYLFASDAGGFGDDENIIKCGSFTTDGSGLFSVTLGFEPQWILVKRTSGTGNWFLVDAMRGLTAAGIDDALLLPNSSSVEIDSNWFDVTATGFNSTSSNPDYNSDYIYIAIRRPMKTPESGTEVFDLGENRTSIGNQTIGTLGAIDMCMSTQVPTPYPNYHWAFTNRLVGGDKFLASAYTQAEATAYQAYDTNTGVINSSWFTSGGLWYNFKRATGFFDVVAFSGSSTLSERTYNHNLGVQPELIIIKGRSGSYASGDWNVATNQGAKNGESIDTTKNHTGFQLNATNGITFGTSQNWSDVCSTTTFTTNGAASYITNSSGNTIQWSAGTDFIAYLFATLAGVSKVGSYTGTGADLNVDCGFSAGARFILIKRTDAINPWYVWDSERGIVAGNDPYLLLNSAAAEVTNTDYIDPLSSGFTVTSSASSTVNVSSGTYIFLAIA